MRALSDAQGVREYLTSFASVVTCTVRIKILQHIEDRNLLLQSGSISLNQEVANIGVLQQEIISLRKNWDSMLAEAQNIVQTMGITPEFTHSRQRKRQHTEERKLNSYTTQVVHSYRDDILKLNLADKVSLILKLPDQFKPASTQLSEGTSEKKRSQAPTRAMSHPQHYLIGYTSQHWLLRHIDAPLTHRSVNMF
ncbi:hypothetical protein PAMP_020553 [Pampus punctatissimus]